MTSPAALVLAGTRSGGDPFAHEMGVSHKALIELNGRTLLERVVSALRDGGIANILVSCDDPEVVALAEKLGAQVIAPQAGPSASVADAFDATGAPLVVTTSDHALLHGDWVGHLIQHTPSDADLSIMLAQRELVEQAVPGSRRTYLTFADGGWSGCNLFYLARPDARRALDTWSMVEAHRKQPWKIAARLGPGTLLAMLLRRLTLAEGLSRLGAKIGVRAHLVPAPDGLAAVDIDKRSDLELVRALLKRK